MVDIVIVNWNSGSQLKRCIDSISSANDTSVINRIYIVDNNSTDRSAEQINHPLVIFIRNEKNIGFAAACNQAFRICTAEYVLLLNPDAMLQKNTLVECFEFMNNNHQVDILGCRLLNDGGATSISCARFPRPIRFFYDATGLSKLFPALFTPATLMTDWQHDESRSVDQVMGAFMFMRSNVFDKVGYFDERFFVYYEELDFSKRLKDAGGMSFFNHKITALHSGGGTTGNVKAFRLFLSLDSRLKYAKKHFSKSGYFFVAGCTLLIEPFTRCMQAIFKGDFKMLKNILDGYRMLIRRKKK